MFTNLICAVVLLLALSATANAQSGNTATDGFTPEGLKAGAPAGSYQLTGFDNVNYFNGNLNFNLPLLHVGGRGSAGFTIPLRIERKWRVIKTPSPPWVNTPEPNDWQALDLSYAPGVLIGRRTGLVSQSCNSIESSTTDTLTRFTFTAGDGTEYELRDKALNGMPGQTIYSYCSVGLTPNRGKVFTSADGTGVTFISNTDILDSDGSPVSQIYPNGLLLMPDGSRYGIDSGRVMWIRDRNGNMISFQYGWGGVSKITDSLNRVVNIAYGNDPATPYNDHDEITWIGFGVTNRTIKVWYTQMSLAMGTDRSVNPPVPYTIKTYAQLFPEMNGSGSTQFNQQQILSAVELPDGRTYQFRYNSYGELARVELPTGGAIEYDYAAGIVGLAASGSYGGGGQYIDKQVYRRVVERRVYADKDSSVFEYKTTISRPDSSGGNLGYVDVENRNYSGALLSKERHYYLGSARVPVAQLPTNYSPWKTGKEWKTESFANNGSTTLGRAENTWQQPQDGYSWPLTQPETNDTVRPNNPKITQTLSALVDANRVSKQTFAYDAHFNRTDVYEYDYGSGAPPTYATRHTHIDYVTINSVNSINYAGPASGPYYTASDYHIRNLPSKQIVYSVNTTNGAETRAAQTEYEYDNYDSGVAYHADLLGRSNISGMDSAYTATNSKPARGNVTKVKRYKDAAALTGPIESFQQFDVAGNVLVAVDGRNNSTTFEYNDRYGSPNGQAQANSAPSELSTLTSYAFPTKVINALSQTVYTQFDYYLGKPVDREDSNGVVSSASYDDDLDRPTQVIRANTSSPTDTNRNRTTFAYDDESRLITTTSDRDAFGDNLLKSEMVYDGLGRTVEARTYAPGPAGCSSPCYSLVKTTYDGLGRTYQVSNPYWNHESPIWTTTQYDGLSRVLSVATPDGATVVNAYDGARALVTDQAGKQRISETNALGHLINVWEVTAADPATESVSFPGYLGISAGYRTKYAYDALDNLKTVTQQIGTGGTTQTRTFGYDSLKRLTSATNPETGAGAITYQYDGNGNLTGRTDTRGIITTINYDVINRPISKSYTGGTPTVNYFYDAQTLPTGAPSYSRGKSTGRLVGVTYGGGSAGSYYGYDSLGRVTIKYQRTGTTNYQISATYNKAGALTGETYPSGRAVTYAYDTAGRLSSFTGDLGDAVQRNYATGITYTSAGLMAQEKFQAGTGSQLYHNLHYNNRLQLYDARLGTGSGIDGQTTEWTWNRGALRMYYSSNWAYGDGGLNNNGNLYRMDHYVPLNESGGDWVMTEDYYGYDALNRVSLISELSDTYIGSVFQQTGSAGQNYSYDRYGNRKATSATGGLSVFNPTYDLTNNRINGLSYDGGNITLDMSTGGTMSYDAENRLLTATSGGGGSYTYDGEGKRVKRITAGQEWWYVYGIGGELLAEYLSTAPTTVKKEYGYRGGQALMVYDSTLAGNAQMKWLVTDHLGSTRMEADKSGSLGGMRRHDYAPFGQEMYAGFRRDSGGQGQYGYEPPQSNVRQRFGSKERDIENGLDFFEARYFSSVQGRFTSADNFLNDTHAVDPSSWNLYAYVRNNPLRYTDPTGEKVYAGDLSQGDQDELLKRINFTYGCQSCVTVGRDGYLAVDASGLSKDVAGATQYLTDAINGTDYFAAVAVSNNDESIAFGQNLENGTTVTFNGQKQVADKITLDFGDDRVVSGNKNAAQAFMYTVFAHEVAHGYPNRKSDPAEGGNNTGPVVDAVNLILQARGLPLRQRYSASPSGTYWAAVPHGYADQDKKTGQIKYNQGGGIMVKEETKLVVRWVRNMVGGRGIN
ncbi:MAG TPA: RHS repeat-associated core domain-containing protein [Blastocatellia bacterium]|nr:RHS repeat-associated core domain-containing protein [Blastocatellia bacterium]